MLRKLLVLFFAAALATSAFAQNRELHKLFDDEWEWQLRDDPERATYRGDRRYDALLTDRSFEAYERRRAHDRELLAKIKTFDRAKLSAADQLNYDVFREDVELRVAGAAFPEELVPLNQMGGIFDLMPSLVQAMPRDSVRDYENYIARLKAFPRAVDQTIALMKRGAEQGIAPPRVILRDVEELIANQIVDDPAQSSIYQLGFDKFGASIPAADQARLRNEALAAIRDSVVPTMRRFREFWISDYYRKTRDTSIAISDLPNGKAWYAWRVRNETTTKLTPDEIHAIGLSEVKRIRAEMETIKERTGFKGTLAEFFDYLRSDPKFYYSTREELLQGYRDVAKRIDPELVRLFGKLPRLPYGVIPVPAYAEKVQTTAYYNSGSPESHRPGYMFANLYALNMRPKWEMEALTLHEAVPGHHLQIALAQELENVPKFRRYSFFTAYTEGWGLYAESLGPELGMYTDPYSRFGQLTYEMWRAVRLVVDTGMHAKGWTREQAIRFFADNASKTQHDIEVEVDRYIAWPGQALAYKLGELKIKELKATAQRELGASFDVRAFHDTVLGNGPLPLSLLERRVREWIDEQKKPGRAATVTLVVP